MVCTTTDATIQDGAQLWRILLASWQVQVCTQFAKLIHSSTALSTNSQNTYSGCSGRADLVSRHIVGAGARVSPARDSVDTGSHGGPLPGGQHARMIQYQDTSV